MWKDSYFDGNSWFGVVDSPEKFSSLAAAYSGKEWVLRARIAPPSVVQRETPPYYHLGYPEARTGELPNFGFRREQTTLGEWLAQQGVDVAGVF